MVDDGRSSVFPWSVGLFRLFSCLFVRMSVWCMASICMSLVVCWLFLKWYVDSREVFHLVVCGDCLVFGRDTVPLLLRTCVVAFSCVCCSKCGA